MGHALVESSSSFLASDAEVPFSMVLLKLDARFRMDVMGDEECMVLSSPFVVSLPPDKSIWGSTAFPISSSHILWIEKSCSLAAFYFH